MAFGHAFSVTERGKETLQLFEDSLPNSEREKLSSYALKNRESLRTETQLVSSMQEKPDGSYEVRMAAQERDRVVLEIRLSVATRSMAQKIRSVWTVRAEEIYSSMLEKLLDI